MCTQGEARVNGQWKTKRKGQEIKFERQVANKSTFWLLPMHKIKILQIFVSNLEEIYLSGEKNAFMLLSIRDDFFNKIDKKIPNYNRIPIST